MRHFVTVCGAILLVSFLAGCSGCSKTVTGLLSGSNCDPSSEIPDKREYPVNEAVSPCENFYEYACSKPLACFELREDRSRHILAINDAAERLLNQKQDYMKQVGSRKDLSPRAQMLKDNYLACMDEEAGKKEEQEVVASVLAAMEKLDTKEKFQDYLGEQVLTPKFSYLDFGRIANLDNSSWYDVYVDPESVRSLPEHSYYEKEEVVKDFTAVVTSFFETIGEKDAAKRADSVVQFESDFSKSYPKPEEIRELITQRLFISRADLLKKYPNLKLAGLLKALPQRTKIRHLFDKSFAHVNEVLGETSLEVLKDVYLYRSLSGYMDDAYPDFFKKGFEFRNKHLGGPPKRPVRQERCTRMVMNRFTKELDAELIEELFPDFPVDKFEALVEQVRTAMVKRLEKNTWLSAKGKEGALKKMKATKMQLVRPKTEAEWDFLPTAKYDPKKPIANSRLRSEKLIEKVLKEFNQERNRDVWSMGPLTVNAYYSPSDNKFVMLQGILQYPFFDVNAPDYVNLGAAGMVVGHELGHAIDDKGAKYDENGELKQWMSDEDLGAFKKLGAILVEQYGNADPKHNGNLTLGENIADVTGLSFGYSAAFPENEGSLEAKKAFFLQYARLWCGKMRPSELERRLKTDPHAQTNVRVNEPIKHQAGFYEAYGCKVGDEMYLPEDKRMNLW